VEKYAGGERPHVRRKWLCSAALPLAHFFRTALSEAAPQLVPFEYRLATPDLDASGQVPVEDPPPLPEIRARELDVARKQYGHALNDFQPGPAVVLLRELLDSSRADGVPAAMLLMAEGPEFRSWYAPGVWRNVEDCLDRVAAETATPLIDAHAWMPEEAFRDSHHMRRAAALRFTDRLAREEIAPLVLDCHSKGNRSAAAR
jgi:hypothetical protein